MAFLGDMGVPGCPAREPGDGMAAILDLLGVPGDGMATAALDLT